MEAKERLIPHEPPAIEDLESLQFENYDEKDFESTITKIECCKYSCFKITILSILSVLIFPLLLIKWIKSLRTNILYTNCTLKYATFLKVYTFDNKIEIVNIQNIFIKLDQGQQKQVKKFIFRYLPYEISYEKKKILPIKYKYEIPYSDLHSQATGLTNPDIINNNILYYGKCQLETPYKSVLQILLEEIFNPFYVFQICSFILWFWDGYMYYA